MAGNGLYQGMSPKLLKIVQGNWVGIEFAISNSQGVASKSQNWGHYIKARLERIFGVINKKGV